MQHPNKSAADIAARLAFFGAIANDLIQTNVLPGQTIVYLPSRLPPMTDGYYLLNDAYKRWRIHPKHRTKPSKIAALTCMAIMTFLPFRSIVPAAPTAFNQIKCNEIYALACALAILQNPLGIHNSFNRNLAHRLFDIFSRSAARQSLQPFLVDLGMRIVQPTYTLNVHDDDKLAMESLITIFELLEKQFKIAGDLATL